MAIKTFTTGEVLTASDTNTYLANGGLVTVVPTSVTNGTVTTGQATINVTAQTSVTINGIFTSTFNDYFLVGRATSASGDIYVQLTNAGTPVTTNTYNYAMMQAYGGAGATAVRTANTNGMTLFAMGAGTTAYCAAYVDISSPYVAEPTLFTVQNNRSDANYQTPANYLWYGNQADSTSFDGIKIYAAGNITGRFTIYGRRV
jgi:hypothetical protein